MKVLILGGGVIGVTSAWYLARAGHEVTLVERQPEVALETSFANAGMLSFDYSTPWGGPGVPLKAIKWSLQEISPLHFNLKEFDFNTVSWMLKMLAQCNSDAFNINKERMLRVARYSRDCFADLRHELPIQYDGRQRGTLVVFRSPEQIEAAEKDLSVLRKSHIPHELLDREACLKAEPALAHVKDKVAGGLSLPGDETGDCHKFTQSLAQSCRDLGVNFMLSTRIDGLQTKGNDIEFVRTSAGDLKADAYLMALGSYSPLMLAPLDIHLPVYPLKGYSLTMPVLDESRSPVSTVMDESAKVAITRFDDRIRVGGIAEIASYNTQLDQKRRRSIEHSVRDLFPGAGDVDNATFWTGLRPMTPDSVPVLGPTQYKNLWLNTGHGTLGWTMSMGSAHFISDMISGRTPEIDPAGLSLARYS